MGKPYHSKYGDRICIDGWLWELTYSEMAPPDSRQATGIKCPTCASVKAAALAVVDSSTVQEKPR
jgi:hypothetical protein